MYAVTSIPLVKRIRATFRSAEFGFFGVVVNTFKHTPRLNGDVEFTGLLWIVLKYRPIAGDFDFFGVVARPFLISCLIVGILFSECMGLANYCVAFLAYSLKGVLLHLGRPLVGALYFIQPHTFGVYYRNEYNPLLMLIGSRESFH